MANRGIGSMNIYILECYIVINMYDIVLDEYTVYGEWNNVPTRYKPLLHNDISEDKGLELYGVAYTLKEVTL
jgi:hypothetical protein